MPGETALAALLLAGCALLPWGCSSGSSTVENSSVPTPTPDPRYAECMSTVPVDSGDPNKPVITLVGPRVVAQPLGAPYTDAGSTATDPRDGDMTARVTVTGLAGLNTNSAGDYMIRYDVANSAQVAGVEAVRLGGHNVQEEFMSCSGPGGTLAQSVSLEVRTDLAAPLR